MIARDALKDIAVLNTVRVLLSIPNTPHHVFEKDQKTSFMNTLSDEFETMFNAIRFAYEFTRGDPTHPSTPPSIDWNQVVSEHVDPIFAHYRLTVTNLSKSIIQISTDLFQKHVSNGIFRASLSVKRHVSMYIGPPTYIHQYSESVDKHLWSIEAFLWRHFAQWRLQQTSNFRPYPEICSC